MSRLARGEYLDPQSIQIAHITTRCVRRAFLCGEDPLTGKCYEHRRQWIERRLEFLASVFAIDCLTFAVMSNHVHLILRTRPDIVRTWSDNPKRGQTTFSQHVVAEQAQFCTPVIGCRMANLALRRELLFSLSIFGAYDGPACTSNFKPYWFRWNNHTVFRRE